jgi:tRNA-specific 2-thiouridylase
MDPQQDKVRRALGLCSGGLDSILAALVLKQQGLAVEWITFETPFFSAAKARLAAAATGIPLTVQNITPTYLKMLRQPACGYGRHMNPCLDCHALMFKLAGEQMQRLGCAFLFSGEVLGQRPMSQTRSSLRYVEKHSGFAGYILRPLSARNLPPTVPEKMGWVRRELLLDFSGRSRKPQMNLAASFGIRDYPTPAGGCLLTDPGYARRLRDLFEHQAEIAEADLELLKYGRHLRLNTRTKIIVGRNQTENDAIATRVDARRDMLLVARGYPGPTVLVPGGAAGDVLQRAAALCAGYGKGAAQPLVEVQVNGPEGQASVQVSPGRPDSQGALML